MNIDSQPQQTSGLVFGQEPEQMSTKVPQRDKKRVPPQAPRSGKSAKKKISQSRRASVPGTVEINAVLTLCSQGRITEAGVMARSLSVRFPQHGFGWKVLGAVFQAQTEVAEAFVCMQEAVRLMPGDAEAHSNLARNLKDQDRLTEAEASLRRALTLKPDYVSAHGNLGLILGEQGQHTEAIKSYRRALEIQADNAVLHSSLLFCLSHNVWTDPQQLYAEHLTFGEQYEAPLRAGWQDHGNIKDPERCLQVGFVSGDLCNHAVASFLEPVLEFLAKKQTLSLHAFYTHTLEDEVTQRLRAYFAHWHAVGALSDAELATQIRAEGIDILIDLSGHTVHNRLLTFARKPAPIQATWLGYPGTTGLRAMDYHLCDRFYVPVEMAWQFSEKSVYLPASAIFLPSAQAPPVSTLPASENGYVTFGSFNRPNKINSSVIALWSLLLHKIPHARMVLGGIAADGQAALTQRFSDNGIERSRLTFFPRSNIQDYLALHHQVDICLDTFPYGGGTTTLHAAWMGVPTLTLAGETPASRVGTTLMSQLELDRFVAVSIDDFVNKGSHWAEHVAELATLREGMRARFDASIMSQPSRFANNLEAALRTMWQRWCDGMPVAAIDTANRA